MLVSFGEDKQAWTRTALGASTYRKKRKGLNKAGQRNYLDFAGPMKGLIRIGYGHALNPSFPVNYIRVPQGGLEGQVIINALVGLSGWSRPVFVGSVDVSADDLSPKPGYWETSSEIGGGAVGAVPYETHFTDCFPVFSTDDEEYPTLQPSRM